MTCAHDRKRKEAIPYLNSCIPLSLENIENICFFIRFALYDTAKELHQR